MSRVAVIVVNWNNFQDTYECVESLQKMSDPSFNIVMVDNGSTDGSPKRLNEKLSMITLIENPENVGYAEGNNVGIRYAFARGAEYIFLLNNDTIVDPDVLNDLIKIGEQDKAIGIVGPKIYDYYEPSKVWFAGAYIDWKSGESSHLGKGEIDHGQFNTVMEVDRLTGCAMLVKREVFEKIGLLDPEFFLYFEDVDFCVRARKAGYKIVCAQNAKVWHKESVTTKANLGSPIHSYYHNRNRLLFLNKHGKISIREHIKNLLRIFIGSRYKRLGIMDYYLGRFGRKSHLEKLS
jgi:GT2 family glycosyltransferase